MKKNFNILISTILILILFLSLNENKYITDYNLAKEKSIEKNMPLLLCFEETYSKKQNLKEAKNYYIVCVLTIDKNKELFEEYKIKKIPSYVIVDQKTQKTCSIEGEESKQKVIQWLFSNIRKNQSKQIKRGTIESIY